MKQRSKSGYALVTIIGIMTILSITFTMLTKITGQTAFNGRRIRDRAKATAYAEAGIEFAYSVLRDNRMNFENVLTNHTAFRLDTSSALTAGADLESSYGGDGKFILNITPYSNHNVVVNSRGFCGEAEVEAEVLIIDKNYNPDFNEHEAFDQAIAGGSQGTFGGTGVTEGIPGIPIYVNDAVKIMGNVDVNVSVTSPISIDLNNKTIQGTATAPVVDTGNSGTAEGGIVVTAVPPIYIPTIDLDPYYNRAVKNNQYFSAAGGTYEIQSNITPQGGVIFIDGDVKIFADVSGTVIATGNITIVGGGVRETGSGISMATETGNIDNRSQGTSEGLIYSRTGNYSQQSGGTIIGQIIVGGSVSKTGNADMYFQKSPPDYEYLGAAPVISGWQK